MSLSCSDAVPHCSADVGLIPPYDRVILETAFRRINSWAVNTLREAIIYANDTFKKAETSPNTTPDDFHGGLSLGALPVARFLLATLGILTSEHNASDMSLILNSGAVGLAQTIMRLAGPCEASEEEDSSLAAIIDEAKAAKKVAVVAMTGPEMAKRMKIGTRVVRGPDWKWGDQVHLFCLFVVFFLFVCCCFFFFFLFGWFFSILPPTRIIFALL